MSNLSRKIAHLKGELLLHTTSYPDDIKPNFSALARATGLNRHTVARVYKGMMRDEKPKKRKPRTSKFDPFDEEIKDRIDNTTASLKAVFKYMQRKYGKEIFNSYDSFKSHVKARKLAEDRKSADKPHPRFETEHGEQVQFDWKEDMTMKLKNGEEVHYSLFSAVYGASRQTRFIYTKTKTKEDLIRCLIQFINDSGGLPTEFITDNMAAIVSCTQDGKKKKHPEILQLEKDINTPIRLLPIKDPRKKGKVESANRYQNWLEAYQGQLESEEDLISLVKELNVEINQEKCQTTGIPRYILFKKEKEHLKPLPSPLILDHYLRDVGTTKVPTTLLVPYKGSGYSVPKKFLGKRVKLVPIENELFIYYNGVLIAEHPITNAPINYRKEDYVGALESHYKEEAKNPEIAESIKLQAEKNLDLFKALERQRKDYEGE